MDYLETWLLLGEVEATAIVNGKLIYKKGSLTDFENTPNKDGSISIGNKPVLDKLQKLDTGLFLFKDTNLPEWAENARMAANS